MGALALYTGGWDRASVSELAHYADAAYESGVGTLIESTHTDTQCFLHDAGTHAVLSFRGTEVPNLLGLARASGSFWDRLWGQLKDLWTDLMITQDGWVGGGYVHHGFLRAFTSVEKEIYDALHDLPPESRKNLFITGHSLGGALATLAASRFGCRMVATFGSPRVGDREFAKAFSLKNAGKYYRVFNRSDIVARIPVPIRFKHCGLPIFITYQGEIYPRPGYLIRIAALARNSIRGNRASLLGDHGIHNYLEALTEKS